MSGPQVSALSQLSKKECFFFCKKTIINLVYGARNYTESFKYSVSFNSHNSAVIDGVYPPFRSGWLQSEDVLSHTAS